MSFLSRVLLVAKYLLKERKRHFLFYIIDISLGTVRLKGHNSYFERRLTNYGKSNEVYEGIVREFRQAVQNLHN